MRRLLSDIDEGRALESGLYVTVRDDGDRTRIGRCCCKAQAIRARAGHGEEDETGSHGATVRRHTRDVPRRGVGLQVDFWQ